MENVIGWLVGWLWFFSYWLWLQVIAVGLFSVTATK
jgi:amino acid transporter